MDNDQATLEVINSFIQIGMEDLSEGRPCFINFTYNLLENDIPSYFPPKTLVIEILETVTFTDDLIDICRKLKLKGYKLALDDFEMVESNSNFHTIMSLVNIVKIDIQKTTRDQQLYLLNLLKKYNVDLLAEKVETREEYEKCLKDGYKYFQGYYFSKPIILSTSDLKVQHTSYYEIMGELSQANPDIERITYLIERDVSISYKVLKLINSPLYRRLSEIKSIKQAIVLLGLNELSKWIYLLYIRDTKEKTSDIPNEVIKMCLTRAKASELIALHIGKKMESSSYFLTGIFSLIDTLLKQPLEKVMEQLPLYQEIKDTILGSQTPYREVLDLVIAIEKGEWSEINKRSEGIGLKQSELAQTYISALKWTQEVLKNPAKV
ncbi:EAL and HDOD domain-containing protein [Alkalihalobacterium alkalinitrilicum]|uniref:EAL and HDOD domain-containing protein n=1 Tax=Alkalihalobacterium alkalinitrilicum TaxID=427920 RepID=UPI000995A8D8|nr:HDOD domain-containing protein [Alkalihalobacterium alkalinitrilicum]